MSSNATWNSEAREGARGEALVRSILEAAGATVRQAAGNHPQYDLMARWPQIEWEGGWAEAQVEVKTQLRAERYNSVLVETEVCGHPDGIRHPGKTASVWVFVVGRDGRTPERILFMNARELGEHVDYIEQTRGLSNALRGSHPGRGARVYFAGPNVVVEERDQGQQ